MKSVVRNSLMAFALVGSLFAGAGASAAPEKQVIDVAHSTLDFTAVSFLLDTEGTFKSW